MYTVNTCTSVLMCGCWVRRKMNIILNLFTMFLLFASFTFRSWGSPAQSPVVSTRCFTGLVRVGLNFALNGNRANVYAHVAWRGGGAWACLAHGLQCLCDGRAGCPSLPKQLVICRFLSFHRRRHVVDSTCCFTGLVWVGLNWLWNDDINASFWI